MATKLTVPRPDGNRKIKPQEKKPPEITLVDANELIEEEVDNTEPSGPPVIAQAAPPPAPKPEPPGILIVPAPPPSRPIAMSLPSQYELDSERKSSPPVLERRKQLTKLVASAVGVAWFICIVAMGQTALRTLILH
jgi:hypothetical protein